MTGELRDFEIPWFGDGRWKVMIIRAHSYPDACFQAGLKVQQRFDRFGRPKDFEANLGGPGVCSVCGCTETNCRHCIEKTGEPCSWANEERTVCTACVSVAGLAGAFSISL